MANFHESLDSTCKRRISKYSHVGSGGSIPQHLIPNWEMKDLHWYFSWGFQICIFNTKNGKLTFSNGPQLMEKSLWQIVMHHCMVCAKEEFQNILMLGQGGPFHNIWSQTEKWKIYIDIFHEVLNLHFQYKK